MWFFGTGNLVTGKTNATLTANGAGAGTFIWTVTNGVSKLAFDNGLTTETKTSGNTVGIESVDKSATSNDVTVELKFTPSGGSQLPTTFSLTIDSPYKLTSNGSTTNFAVSACASHPSGTAGFASLVPYSIQSLFGVAVQGVYINESFGTRTDIYTGNNWINGTAGSYLASDGTFVDELCYVSPGYTPTPLVPQTPLSSTEIYTRAQMWWVGSMTSGNGLEVQTDTIGIYQDHGVHTSVVSPIP